MPITINGLTGISGADGSAATPFIRGSDNDTGLYFPSAGNAAISINGSQALLVDNNYNITTNGNVTAGNLTIAGTMTTANSNVTGTVVMSSSFKRNRIINGNMVIDQRNAGATANGSGGNKTYPVDRFYSQLYNTTGNTTGQQSSTAPSGFTNSMKISVQTADTSVGATDQVWYGQDIEGFNVSDFGFGASGAATITLSFWVYSNVTGTYCVTFKNSAQNRGYTAEYTISASNTWEKKTITLAGDTTGTWLTTNGAGLSVWFVLMAGSSQQTTANTWNATSGSIATSNQVNFMSSTSNAWYITGVQLEVGTKATPYEFVTYSEQLAQCQRYYQFADQGVSGGAVSTTVAILNYYPPVQFRTLPTVGLTAAAKVDFPYTTNYTQSSASVSSSFASINGGINMALTNFSGLTTYSYLVLRSDGGKLTFSAEL